MHKSCYRLALGIHISKVGAAVCVCICISGDLGLWARACVRRGKGMTWMSRKADRQGSYTGFAVPWYLHCDIGLSCLLESILGYIKALDLFCHICSIALVFNSKRWRRGMLRYRCILWIGPLII